MGSSIDPQQSQGGSQGSSQNSKDGHGQSSLMTVVTTTTRGESHFLGIVWSLVLCFLFANLLVNKLLIFLPILEVLKTS